MTALCRHVNKNKSQGVFDEPCGPIPSPAQKEEGGEGYLMVGGGSSSEGGEGIFFGRGWATASRGPAAATRAAAPAEGSVYCACHTKASCVMMSCAVTSGVMSCAVQLCVQCSCVMMSCAATSGVMSCAVQLCDDELCCDE